MSRTEFRGRTFAAELPRKPTVRVSEDHYVALTLRALELGIPTRTLFERLVADVPDTRKR